MHFQCDNLPLSGPPEAFAELPEVAIRNGKPKMIRGYRDKRLFDFDWGYIIESCRFTLISRRISRFCVCFHGCTHE